MDHIIWYYFSLLFAPLFLLAFIKRQQGEKTKGRRLLILGFTLLTIQLITLSAEFFELIQSGYHPYMDTSWSSLDRFAPWERWYYWGKHLCRWTGYILVAVGFFLEARRLQGELKRKAFNSLSS